MQRFFDIKPLVEWTCHYLMPADLIHFGVVNKRFSWVAVQSNLWYRHAIRLMTFYAREVLNRNVDFTMYEPVRTSWNWKRIFRFFYYRYPSYTWYYRWDDLVELRIVIQQHVHMAGPRLSERIHLKLLREPRKPGLSEPFLVIMKPIPPERGMVVRNLITNESNVVWFESWSKFYGMFGCTSRFIQSSALRLALHLEPVLDWETVHRAACVLDQRELPTGPVDPTLML